MRARSWSITVVLASFATVLGFSCGSRTRAEDPAAIAAREASIATRPINDPPWAIGTEDTPVTKGKPSPTPSAAAKPVTKADAGVPAPVAAAPADAGLDAAKAPVAVKFDCVSLCTEARACIERLAGSNVDCNKECERTKPDDLERGIRCRTELAKSCEAWMTCLVGTGS